MAEPENAESTVQFDAEDYEEHQENLNQETPTEFPKSDIKQYFTFDDVPPSKWRERSIEMLTWCTAELQYYTIDVVIKRFLTRLQGRLRDWYHSLGEYRQLQIQQSISPEAFMSIIYSEFIGSPWEHTTHAREEFLKMKCCSFQKKDLEKHYDRMSQRFYVKWSNYVQSQASASFAKKEVILQEIDPDNKKISGTIPALNHIEPVDVSDLESLYSLDDEPSDSVLCTIAYSDFSSDDDSDTDSLESDSDFEVHMINPIPHVLPIQEDPPLPLAKVHLLTDAYAKPISVIAFFDTGSSVSILNPNILPDHYWKPHHQNFMAANGEKFNPPQWTSRQTEAVKAIKCLEEKMPPLKIPASSEKRILQTDASDECWGANLLVKDNNNKRHVCGYNSCTFKASEQHYHSMFKEIRAVKRGIEKFQFHLIGHEFQVEMDMSSIPYMLQFKRKMLPYTRSLMARANGVDPDKIPYYLIWNILVWNKDHLDAYKWIEANKQWLYDNFDHCDVETSDDHARSLWSSDDNEHFDPFKDDPIYPDAR
ncbi:putative zinc finger, CCHC-type containing protein [Tanacetum coccineum]